MASEGGMKNGSKGGDGRGGVSAVPTRRYAGRRSRSLSKEGGAEGDVEGQRKRPGVLESWTVGNVWGEVAFETISKTCNVQFR